MLHGASKPIWIATMSHHGQEAIHEAIHYSQKSLDELYSYLYSMGQNSAVTPSPSLPGSGWEILGNLGRSWESQWSPYDLDVMGTFWRKKMAISQRTKWGVGVIAIFVPYFCPEQLWMPFTIKRLLRQKGKGCPKCNVTYTPTSSYCQQQLDMLFPRIWDGFPAEMISISAVGCRPQFMEILISEWKSTTFVCLFLQKDQNHQVT